MHFDRKHYTDETLLALYKGMLLPRMIEEKMLVLLRQGKISKWFSGIGQEAIAVGVTMAMQPDEWIMPLHRNLGVFTSRNMPLHKLFKQWQGHQDGYSKGRERSFHFGSKQHYICGMISHLGPQMALADGVALAYKLSNTQKASASFCGDGGTSEGDFHEALNVAAVWDLPTMFIIENNGYGLSTPVQEQFKCTQLASRGAGYGMEAITIDGNNILEVYDTIMGIRNYCIEQQKPYLIECMTFRMRGHEEASGVKYVPPELFETWAAKDPVKNYEDYLLTIQVLNEEGITAIKEDIKKHIEAELAMGFETALIVLNEAAELQDVYAPHQQQHVIAEAGERDEYINKTATSMRMLDAIKEALLLSMQQHNNLVLMGQDIAEYGGAFKITEGLVDLFGKQRVRNTPLCESAIVGAALGLSLEKYKAVMEMQFADFVTVGFNQIVNNLAKMHYRWGQCADVVIRMPTGGGVGAGPFHSQSNEAWFTHVPGLKVVYPSNPEDAKGLLTAAINDPNPILFFEHKALYRSKEAIVPQGYYEKPIGKASVVKSGNDISIITYGMGVYWALDYANTHTNITIDIIDLRTLLPLDYEAIKTTVQKTGKVLILHEDNLFGGIGGEISAWISEHCFEYLDAPVIRCASIDTPIPFNTELEQQFLAKKQLNVKIQQLLKY
jgi:2-oxoisovalerate dehydrogenase E1 component